ncbi:adhesion G protein-coupled receptor E2 [Octopus bimaculoides]|uniref:EGF-like domain-containing protein n=1 Tax=Octopus bimaculoides TaxID=37653 RepID=A0A0L8G764_OCTBM|nr:adhesion G protein-coupled receptor E2 [Octopus bimaculoides]|eukprot:XP_014783437.1 PREDICTED: adhesion G protein-coupled receptor E2-like isoform X1 [Octopus bimaculoides]
MKNLVVFLFVFVVGLWLTEGQRATESPGVSDETSIYNETADSGNSTAEGESLLFRPPIVCSETCYKRMSYQGSRRGWCWFKRCTKYRVAYKIISSNCYKCCRGWTGTPGNCRDTNECKSQNRCGRFGTCINTIGSYKCHCIPGFEFNGRTCVDSNECNWTFRCRNGSTCINALGSYICLCKPGYICNGKICVGIG